MLKGIDPRLGADVLHTMRAMGHGDVLVVVDTNFPAVACAKDMVVTRPLSMDNLTLAQATEAILSVLPLDTFEPDPVVRMRVGDDPDDLPPVQTEVAAQLDAPMADVDRFDFYDLAKTAYAVVQTGERRFYGCIALRKGVIPPEDA